MPFIGFIGFISFWIKIEDFLRILKMVSLSTYFYRISLLLDKILQFLTIGSMWKKIISFITLEAHKTTFHLSSILFRMKGKPYLKCYLNLSLAKKWLAIKVFQFVTESPGFLCFFAKISRFVLLQSWQVCNENLEEWLK